MNIVMFINGLVVYSFVCELEQYLGVKYVIFCVNGIDVFQIVMMVLGLELGDEVIMFLFIYIVIMEVIVLLQLKFVFVDVDLDIFCIDFLLIEVVIILKIKVIVLVYLYGQGVDMECIMVIVEKYNFFVIEDNVQVIGVDFMMKDGIMVKFGIIGIVGCIFFFLFKNFGCFGDGGVIMINDDVFVERLKMVVNYG